jgi:hypothetical protein
MIIYSTEIDAFTKHIIFMFDLLNIKYEKCDILNLNVEFQRYPVIQINDNYITNFHGMTDLIESINFFANDTESKISFETIYEKLLYKIYSEPDTNEIIKLVNFINIDTIKILYVKGYCLAHHIICSKNKKLINYFLLNTNLDHPFYTKSYFINSCNLKIPIVGNQSLLHIAVQNDIDVYHKLKNNINDSKDELGYYAYQYVENKNDINFNNKIIKLMKEKYVINFDIDKIIEEIYVNDELEENILQLLNSKETLSIKPNSMHNYGHVVKNNKIIVELLNSLNEKYHLNLDNKIFDIYAFTAEYDTDTNQNLDLHKDNSIITINWCLECSDDLEGTDIHYPTVNKIVKFNKNKICIHHGKLAHFVDNRINGKRKNLIIWIK